MAKLLYTMKADQVRLLQEKARLVELIWLLETGSVLDTHDVSYLNNLHYQQHQRARRRIESASDMDDQSLYSEDVIDRYWNFLHFRLFIFNRLDRYHRFILLNHVGLRLNTLISLFYPEYLVIRPSTASTTGSVRRSRSFSNSDSVQLYSYYRQQWTNQRAPGEKNHQRLRWAVRDQLLQKDIPAKVFLLFSFSPEHSSFVVCRENQHHEWTIT